MRKELEITKDNYEGYLELYKLKTERLTIGQDIIKTILPAILFVSGCYAVVSLPHYFSLEASLFFGIMISVSLVTGISSVSIEPFFKRKKFKKLKEEYPYLDLKKDKYQIEIALNKVNKGKTTIDSKKWENYYACEEIKKETLTSENREYKAYIYEHDQSEISTKEIKQKVKVLTKIKR